MRHKVAAHARRNIVTYVALVATLSGTSYAAAAVTAGSVPTVAAEKAAVTRDGRDGRGDGRHDRRGPRHPDDPSGDNDPYRGDDPNRPDDSPGTGAPADPPASQGGGRIVAKARSTSSVVARHGGSAEIAFSGNTWTQPADDLELVAGTLVIKVPAKCTGGFGNALTLSVDGKPVTFAAAPLSFQADTVNLPFLIGTLGEPGQPTQHELTAKFANSCSKDGEDYTIENVSVDVLRFH